MCIYIYIYTYIVVPTAARTSGRTGAPWCGGRSCWRPRPEFMSYTHIIYYLYVFGGALPGGMYILYYTILVYIYTYIYIYIYIIIYTALIILRYVHIYIYIYVSISLSLYLSISISISISISLSLYIYIYICARTIRSVLKLCSGLSRHV